MTFAEGLGTFEQLVRNLCQHPLMVFLIETKMQNEKMELVRYKLDFPRMFVVDSVGKSRGMALFWGEEIVVDIQNFSQQHINGIIQTKNSDVPWKFMGFYGHPDVSKCHEAWELLKVLGNLSPSPWICIGDFNEIVSLSEKWGDSGRSSSQMKAFQSILNECELFDLGFVALSIHGVIVVRV
jgi:hypothetical protein